MHEKQLPPFETVLIDKDENDVFVVRIASQLCGDLKVRLAPAVTIALFEAVTNAVALQVEIDKLKPEEQRTFPLAIASEVVKGKGWFKAFDSELARVANELNGVFGAPPAQKGN